MTELLIKFWPMLAAAGGAFAAAVGWSLAMLWKIAQGVKDVQNTLQRHDVLHVEHKTDLAKLNEQSRAHSTAIAALEATQL